MFSFSFSPSYGLTEAVDLFGEINSVDLVLNDIWIKKKKKGVEIHGSLYNAGIIPTEAVSNVVTVGYVVNGELLEIKLLENILPGIENGIEISSGPVFDNISGTYVVTGIVNYHDTLSHLRDNPKNNIVQKIFQIGTELPSIINFDVYQSYNDKTKQQQITVKGHLTDIFREKLENQEIIIDIDEIIQEKIITDTDGQFLFETNIPFKNKPIKISTYLEDDLYVPSDSQIVFPIKMNTEQSALALEIISEASENNLKNTTLTIVLFQDSYDNEFKKISVDGDNKNAISNDYTFAVLPSGHDYIAEIYIDGRLFDAFQSYFPSNSIIEREISFSESAQVQFRIINEFGEPQNNIKVENWIYSTVSYEDGFTDWINISPTFTDNEPYVGKAVLPNGEVLWSEPFLIEPEEKKIIQIIHKGDKK